MTKIPRDKKNLEQKIVQLYIKLHKRKTTKISRRVNLQKKIEFYKTQLAEVMAAQPSVTLTNKDDLQNTSTPITFE